MTNPCDAVWLSVAAIWSAAALASSQTAEAQSETRSGVLANVDVSSVLDIDVAAASGDLQASGEAFVLDLRYRFEAERVLQNGQRWGVRTALAANSGDGRRGFAQILSTGPQLGGQALSGLTTGFVRASGLDAGSGRVELSDAEIFLKTAWLEWQLGWGQTAAAQTRVSAPTALRLSRADRTIADLAGGGISHTGLSLSAPAPRIVVQSRRILGLSATASITPDPQRCGVDICRASAAVDVLSPDIDDLVSVAVTFDRRSPASGVRLQAGVALEHAEVHSGLARFENPWILTGQVMREQDGVTLMVSYLGSNDGFATGRYEAWAATASFERGDWLYSTEFAHGESDVFGIEGASYALAASRWMGDNTLISLGIIAHELGGVAGVLETGLRF